MEISKIIMIILGVGLVVFGLYPFMASFMASNTLDSSAGFLFAITPIVLVLFLVKS